MTTKRRLRWERRRARGRADYALRYGTCMGAALWCVYAIFGNWSGERELVLWLPFYMCAMVGAHWFVLWRLSEWRYWRSIGTWELPEGISGDGGPPMRLPKELLEEFFGAQCHWLEPIYEMRFQGNGMSYRLLLDPKRDSIFLTGDLNESELSFPAIEIGCECKRIERIEASGVGPVPVLMFYASEDKNNDCLRFVITRTRDRRFSISPHWAAAEEQVVSGGGQAGM